MACASRPGLNFALHSFARACVRRSSSRVESVPGSVRACCSSFPGERAFGLRNRERLCACACVLCVARARVADARFANVEHGMRIAWVCLRECACASVCVRALPWCVCGHGRARVGVCLCVSARACARARLDSSRVSSPADYILAQAISARSRTARRGRAHRQSPAPGALGVIKWLPGG